MPAKIFIAGICGTFMAGIAQLARAAGMEVRGCDANVYPPMSDLLRAQNINIAEGYLPAHLNADAADGAKQTILIGNALSRGNPLVEHVLNARLKFTSGAQWLHDNVLRGRRVIAVAGTHGKTSTASMLAWILHCAGAKPGYLIGGQPGNFAASAAPGEGRDFVIEADEYDTAFFDKRAKFVHYEPSIALLNNLEFDHADIYDDLAQIQKQFHYFVRLVPGNGRVIANADDARVTAVLAMGCWSRVVEFSLCNREAEWFAAAAADDASEFVVYRRGDEVARVNWNCIGRHNMQNALAAMAAADAVGVAAADAAAALQRYQPSARRLQLLFAGDSVRLYDDFAHHPTAIQRTIEAVRARHGGRVIAVVELRSNTMKEGAHGEALAAALQTADCALVCGGEAAAAGVNTLPVDEIIPEVLRLQSDENTSIVTMSNGDFAGLPARLCAQLQPKRP